MRQVSLTEKLAWFRANGWSVAVHNDYRLDGVHHTFWLFTKMETDSSVMVAVKGEGKTDDEALDQCFAAVCPAPGSETGLARSTGEEVPIMRMDTVGNVARGQEPLFTESEEGGWYCRYASLTQEDWVGSGDTKKEAQAALDRLVEDNKHIPMLY